MALKNFLKKDKKDEPQKSEAPQEVFGKRSEAFRILKEPHISEKSTKLSEENRYVFKVFPKANKKQIKKAIKDVYKVKVLNVNIVNIPSKKRRLGRIEGKKRGYKKAIVRIKKGQTIELL